MAVTGIFTDSGGTQFKKVAGVLRNTNGNFSILSDANHTPLNIDGISTSTSAITLTYSGVSKMLTFQITPDETYASMGITAGASVTATTATIWVMRYSATHDAFVRINPKTLITTFGNFWIDSLFWV